MPLKLTASAFELFSRHGIAQVNLDRIAAHAGVTKGSLYWHFRSKHDVILAACRLYYRNYHRRINAAIADLQDPLARLERVLRLSIRTCLLDEQNRVFTIEVFTLALHDEEIRAGWRQFYDSVREFYIGLVEAARLAGQLNVSESEPAVNVMLASMEGIKLRALFEPHICVPAEAHRILTGLKQILGFRDLATTAVEAGELSFAEKAY